MSPFGQRIFDIAGAAFLLVLATPVLLIAAIAIRLTSVGPVFFRQVRLGRYGVPFRIYKLRTMYHRPPSGPAITVAGDQRITPIGRLLRRSKIDELPQLLNVLQGEMSLVGPRPEVPAYRHVFDQHFAEVLLSRPGMTDPVSLQLIDEEKFLRQFSEPLRAYEEVLLPRKLQLSLEYLRRRRLRDDMRLIFVTLMAAIGVRRRTLATTSIFHADRAGQLKPQHLGSSWTSYRETNDYVA